MNFANTIALHSQQYLTLYRTLLLSQCFTQTLNLNIYLKSCNSEKKTENKSKAKELENYIDFPFGPVGAVIEQHPVENEIKMWKERIALNGFNFLMFGKCEKNVFSTKHRKHEKCAFFCEEN